MTDADRVTVTLTRREAEIVASVLRERNGVTLNAIANRIEDRIEDGDGR